MYQNRITRWVVGAAVWLVWLLLRISPREGMLTVDQGREIKILYQNRITRWVVGAAVWLVWLLLRISNAREEQ